MLGTKRFEVGRFKFELSPLGTLQSIDLLPNMLDILPSLLAARQAKDDNPMAALAAIRFVYSKARPLIEAFAPKCKVSCAESPTGSVTVGETLDTLFGREHLVLLEWLMQCLQTEYAGFLAEAFKDPGPEGTASASSSPAKPTATAG